MLSKIFLVFLVLGFSANCEELDPILLVKQFFSPAPSTGSSSTSGSSGSSGSSGGSPATTTVAPGSTTTFTPDPLCLNNPTKPTVAQCCIPATDLTNCPAANTNPQCQPTCTTPPTLCLAATDPKCVAPTTPAGGSTAPASVPGTISIRPLISASGPASG